MYKLEIKKIIFLAIFIIINTVISYIITYFLGMPNTIIYHSTTMLLYENITLESIIFMGLAMVEASIYEYRAYFLDLL